MQNTKGGRPLPLAPVSDPRRPHANQTHISPYVFEVTPPQADSPWDSELSADTLHPLSVDSDFSSRPRARTASVFEARRGLTDAAQDADLHRSVSHRSNLYAAGVPGHRPSKSDFGLEMNRIHKDMPMTSFATEASYYDQEYFPTQVRHS